MNIKNGIRGVFGALMLTSIATISHAAPIFNIETTGTWDLSTFQSGGSPIPNVDFGGGTALNTIEWGGGSNRSSYTYNGLTPSQDIDIANGGFPIGEFVHNNQVINNSNSFTVDFLLTVTVKSQDLTATYADDVELRYTFGHIETSNTGFPCCPDIVTIPDGSATINLAGVDYSLDINGFFNSSLEFTEQFVTIERTEQTGSLSGVFVEVTEPSTLALFGLSLLSLGALRRRSKA
jgi:hypothetical protein